MAKSFFALDDLFKVEGYKSLCDSFISLAKDEETKSKLSSILFEGVYKEYDPKGFYGKNDYYDEVYRRLSMAYLSLCNPDTFNEISADNIIYYHGTNACNLPSILKYGLTSYNKSKEQGIEVITGEEWSRPTGYRSFVSFSDVLDISEQYSAINFDKDNQLSFPVVFGVSEENLKHNRLTPVGSDLPEIGVEGCIAIDDINCVLVPSDKVEITKKIVGNRLKVLAVDGIDNKFYQVYGGVLYFDQGKFEEFKKRDINKNSNDRLSGIKEAILTRTLTNIKNIKGQVANLIKGEYADERGSSR